MFRCLVSLLVLTLPCSALAWEGVLEMKFTVTRDGTTEQAAGSSSLMLGEGGILSDTSATANGAAMKLKTLMRKDQPNVAYLIDDTNKRYREVDMAAARAAADEQAKGETWKIEKKGTGTVAGLAATHVVATSSKQGTPLELWTTKVLGDGEAWAKAMGQQGPSMGLWNALKSAGADGAVVKMLRNEKGAKLVMEVTKAEAKKLPATTFELPKGYSKDTSPMMFPGGAMPPEAQRALEERMKQMTPAERKQVEEMMKKAGSTPPPAAPPAAPAPAKP